MESRHTGRPDTGFRIWGAERSQAGKFVGRKENEKHLSALSLTQGVTQTLESPAILGCSGQYLEVLRLLIISTVAHCQWSDYYSVVLGSS